MFTHLVKHWVCPASCLRRGWGGGSTAKLFLPISLWSQCTITLAYPLLAGSEETAAASQKLEQTLNSTEDLQCTKVPAFSFSPSLYNCTLEFGELSITDNKGLVELPLGLASNLTVLSLCCYCLVIVCCVCTRLSAGLVHVQAAILLRSHSS